MFVSNLDMNSKSSVTWWIKMLESNKQKTETGYYTGITLTWDTLT